MTRWRGRPGRSRAQRPCPAHDLRVAVRFPDLRRGALRRDVADVRLAARPREVRFFADPVRRAAGFRFLAWPTRVPIDFCFRGSSTRSS